MKKVEGWFVPDNDDHFVAGLNDYQEASFQIALSCLPSNRRRLAIDVGAHIGIFTVRMARMFARTVAFEPNADNYECLVMNTLRFPHVRPIFGALGLQAGRCSSRIDAPANSGARGVTLGGQIPMFKLDDVCDSLISGPDLLKIDTEGHEGQVMCGAVSTIETHKPVLIVERPPADIDEWLTRIGYAAVGRTSKDTIYSVYVEK